jgi:hypothetical protein
VKEDGLFFEARKVQQTPLARQVRSGICMIICLPDQSIEMNNRALVRPELAQDILRSLTPPIFIPFRIKLQAIGWSLFSFKKSVIVESSGLRIGLLVRLDHVYAKQLPVLISLLCPTLDPSSCCIAFEFLTCHSRFCLNSLFYPRV